jgi:thioredoxin 1
MLNNTTDATFQTDVKDASGTVVVDLWAEWCGPCKAMTPLLEAVATDLEGKVSIYKLDIQANPSTPGAYGVTSIPTILVFKDGEVIDRMVGNPGSKGKLKDFIGKHV